MCRKRGGRGPRPSTDRALYLGTGAYPWVLALPGVHLTPRDASEAGRGNSLLALGGEREPAPSPAVCWHVRLRQILQLQPHGASAGIEGANASRVALCSESTLRV